MPKVTRRRFLQISGLAVAGAAGSKTIANAMELKRGGESHDYARVANKRTVSYTVSPYGKAKNPQEVYLDKGKVVGAGGFQDHPDTKGRSTALDAVAHISSADPDRLLFPVKRDGMRGEGHWKKITWEEAIAEISKRTGDAVSAGKADAISLLLGEDAPDGVFMRFMDTIGSGSIYRMTGSGNKKTAHAATWGEEGEIPDFANSRYILNFGSNIFETFSAHAQSVAAGRSFKHAKLITFDPRMSMTAGLSDQWVPIKPGTDGIVALAMANVIMQEGLADIDFINKWTNISAANLAKHLAQFTPEMAEDASGVKADVIKRIAVEFAASKPATVFSFRGASSHLNGVETERAIMLLPIITGNVETEGGYCLPRRLTWNELKVSPSRRPEKNLSCANFPFAVKTGREKVEVLFCYNTNPAYSSSAGSYWKGALLDKDAIPFSVCVSSYMSETAELCDIVLPEAIYLERNEPVSGASLFPWLGARTPVTDVPEGVRELKVILRDVVQALDSDGAKGYKKFWDFSDPGEWMTAYFEEVKGLKDDGGVGYLKDNGVWPKYGTLDEKVGRVLKDDGKPPRPDYGMHKTGGFGTPSKKIEISSEALKKKGYSLLPTWTKPGNLAEAGEGGKEGLVFITFKTAYRAGTQSANNKYLVEKDHSCHCWINKEKAAEMGIKDGDLIRVISPVGHLVTKAKATNAIHPAVIGMAGGFGHTAVGRVAAGERHHKPEWAEGEDKDVHHNMWWDDNGVNPNDIIPLFVDPVSGSPVLSFNARVEKASVGDKYGDVKTDIKLHEAFFKKALDQVRG